VKQEKFEWTDGKNARYYSSKGRLAEKEHALLLERINRLEQLVKTKVIPLEVEERALLEPIAEKVVYKLVEETVKQVEKTDSSNKVAFKYSCE
jgi:hypothetical protein